MSGKIRQFSLSEAEYLTLEQARDHHPKPYFRERAAALLKIATGVSAYVVAVRGLLKRRKAETVYNWLNAYEQHGLAGLYQKPRQNRGFPPS